MSSRTLAVIPARYASSRFPGKPLALIAGKTMIQRVYEAAKRCPDLDDVIVATDDQRIYETVLDFKGKATMTSTEHQTGTDRIAEAIQGLDADLILNIQGDEPLIDPTVLSELIAAMRKSGADMGTAAVPFQLTGRDPQDPNAVKVVCDAQGYALYFSRALIPYDRSGQKQEQALLHWGLYAYKRKFLEQFVRWPQSRLEKLEMLEQLRALENGAKAWVLQTDKISMGVDTPADLKMVEDIIRKQQKNNV
ncbi:MAG: 3-deoxy-manno-octulosonate cytidylyltransferase [Oligosphaeraceae bacterium]|nr:3-deoxy-manno-octulosonate cytidylyltransferase [Oligosphaeraceae bacterium]